MYARPKRMLWMRWRLCDMVVVVVVEEAVVMVMVVVIVVEMEMDRIVQSAE